MFYEKDIRHGIDLNALPLSEFDIAKLLKLLGQGEVFAPCQILDTCTEVTAQLCQIPGGRGGRYKLPTLTELHQFLFESDF